MYSLSPYERTLVNEADGSRRAADHDREHLRARAQTAFRRTKLLVGAYLTVSVLTLLAIVVLRNDAAVVNDAVWIRGSIVVGSALLLSVFASRAARGSRGAYRRLRIISAVTVAAITLIIALPGPFPLWMKIDQGVCALLLIGVSVIVNSKSLRSLFASR